MSHSYFAATAADVFAPRRLGGASSLGRDDLGRLAPGALADIIMIDLTGRNSLRYGPVRDPVKSVVECGVGDDIDTVIVDGNVVMQGGVIPGRRFREAAQGRAGRGRADLGDAAGLGPARPYPRGGLSLVLSDGAVSLRNMCDRSRRPKCLQLAGPDMRALKTGSGFDPSATSAANFAVMHNAAFSTTMW